MTAEVMERDPLMTPTIVRRVHGGRIQTMERLVASPDGKQERALSVFWSIEHARREMYANGRYPEDGWKAITRDEEELEAVFGLLAEMGGPTLAYVEPAPGAPELCALLRPAELVAMLNESACE